MIAALAALVAGALHFGALDQMVSGADQARVAGFEPGGATAGLGGAGERDLGPLIYRLQGLLFGDSHRLYALSGLLLLIAVATLAGTATSRLAREAEAPSRSLPLAAGAVTAGLMAAHPLGADLVAQLPGQVTSLALIVFLALLHRGARRPEIVTLFVLPLLASLIFRETLGLGFLLLPLVLVLARPHTQASLVTRRGALALGLLAFGLRVGFEIWQGWPQGARDVGAATTGFLPRLLESARWLFVPAAAGPEGLAPVWIASFGLPLLLIFGLGWAGLGADRRRASLAGLVLLGGGLALSALSAPPDASGGDLRILALPLLGLAIWLGLAADAAARRGPGELVVIALLAFFVYSSFNVCSDWRQRREHEVFGPEYQAVTAEIDRVAAQGAERLAIHGLENEPRAAWSRSLPARHLKPWGRGGLQLSAWAAGDVAAIRAELLPEAGGIILAEWWPATILAAARRPQGWRLLPVFVAPREDPEAAPIRLVSPAPESRQALRRPERIEDDTTFVFESAPGWQLPKDCLFAFYSIYEGGLNPRGRGEVRARPIVPSTLVSRPGPNGWTRHSWRPSIRPEDGHAGVRFENPDLGAEGPFVWTIGAVRLAGEGAAGIPSGHLGHLHDRAAIGVTRPFTLAQTRRVHFFRPAEDEADEN
jgi:hypothetical protein